MKENIFVGDFPTTPQLFIIRYTIYKELTSNIIFILELNYISRASHLLLRHEMDHGPKCCQKPGYIPFLLSVLIGLYPGNKKVNAIMHKFLSVPGRYQ